MGARMLKVVQVMQGCCWFSFMEEAIAKLPILEILPILFANAHLSLLILRPDPPMLPLFMHTITTIIVYYLL